MISFLSNVHFPLCVICFRLSIGKYYLTLFQLSLSLQLQLWKTSDQLAVCKLHSTIMCAVQPYNFGSLVRNQIFLHLDSLKQNQNETHLNIVCEKCK